MLHREEKSKKVQDIDIVSLFHILSLTHSLTYSLSHTLSVVIVTLLHYTPSSYCSPCHYTWLPVFPLKTPNKGRSASDRAIHGCYGCAKVIFVNEYVWLMV